MLTLADRLAADGYACAGPVWCGMKGQAGISSLTGYAERYGAGHHVLDVRVPKSQRQGLRCVLTVAERKRLRMTKQDVRDIRRRDVRSAIEEQIAKKETRQQRVRRQNLERAREAARRYSNPSERKAAQMARYRERKKEQRKAA
jgi:hypothetical protein